MILSVLREHTSKPTWFHPTGKTKYLFYGIFTHVKKTNEKVKKNKQKKQQQKKRKNNKTGKVRIFLRTYVRSAICFEMSRREISIYVAEHEYILKNYQNTDYLIFTSKTFNN